MTIKSITCFTGLGKIIMQHEPTTEGVIVFTDWISEIGARCMMENPKVVGIWKPKTV